ncbi:MAG: cupin domain-containing protein [Bacteroidota bacterium]
MIVSNIEEKFKTINEYWQPKIIAELNGQAVKIAKVKGAFIWHKHDHEDELFLVHKGSLRMEFRDKVERIKEGEILVVPKGVEHRPVAEEETEIIMFEPLATLNTGNIQNERTVSAPERI